MKKINMFVGVSEENENWCSDNCPFIHRSTCLLFNEDLEDVVLPKDKEWNDRTPKLVRCYICSNL